MRLAAPLTAGNLGADGPAVKAKAPENPRPHPIPPRTVKFREPGLISRRLIRP
jgi:hypothetical protein